MMLAIILAIACVIGIIFGIKNKNKALAILSSIALILLIGVWVYFYNNPY